MTYTNHAHHWAKLLAPVHETLADFFSDRIDSPHDSALWQTLKRSTEGGKKIRPLLVMIVATGGDVDADPTLTAQAAHLGAAIELLHTGFLIHDDIMDRDTTRRGRPTVVAHFADEAEQYGSKDPWHEGVAAAIIVGDLALTGTYALLAQCGDRTKQLIAIIDRATRLTAEGQFLDIRTDGPEQPSIEELVKLAQLKTAAYSFEAPLECAAVLREWGHEAREHIVAGARDLGIGFQIMDDVMGIEGDPAITGKSNVSDLSEHKHTVITATARSDPRWSDIWGRMGHRDDQQIMTQARTVLTQTDAAGDARNLARRFHDSARAHFSASPIPSGTSRQLLELTAWLEKRIH